MMTFVLVVLGGILAALVIYAGRKYWEYRHGEHASKTLAENAQSDFKMCQMRSESVGESATKSALAAEACKVRAKLHAHR